MPARLEFDVSFGPRGRRREETDPLRLLLVGDFTRKPPAARPPLATRPTHRLDLDTIDAVIKRLEPRASTAAGDIQFSALDAFHPDHVTAGLELFRTLLDKRASPPADNDELFGRLFGKPSDADGPASASPPRSGVEALIHDIVAPHIVQDRSAQTKPYVAAIDAALTEQMRALLHDPAFQSVEAAWRGAQWLVTELELDENLQLHLFDVAREELATDIVAAGGKPAQTGLYRALVDRWRNVPGGQGWSALVTLYEFGPTDADIGLLAALGLIASQAGGPLLAGAHASLISADEDELGGWNELRRSEAAPWIALAAPRVLLRAPYGTRSDPIEVFPFEEFDGPPEHDALLWGSSALAIALLAGRGFSARGWDMELGDEREIDGLPAYTFTRGGEQEMQPCAERFLTESEIEALLNAGIVPVASRRDRNAVVAIRFQSIADPPAPLVW